MNLVLNTLQLDTYIFVYVLSYFIFVKLCDQYKNNKDFIYTFHKNFHKTYANVISIVLFFCSDFCWLPIAITLKKRETH